MDSPFTIYKYGLQATDVQTVQMPKGAVVMHVGEQPMSKDAVQVWAKVDRREALVGRSFRIVGTGHDLPEDPGEFVGTVVTRGGMLVWHVFDMGETLNA